MPFVLWFLSPIGRIVGIVALFAVALAGVYEKGRIDQRAYDKAQIERQKDAAIKKGRNGAARALHDLDLGRVPGWWFRD